MQRARSLNLAEGMEQFDIPQFDSPMAGVKTSQQTFKFKGNPA